MFDGGYNIEVTGFTTADLDFLLPEPENSAEPETVELPDPATDAVTRRGDLWLMSPHRIFCGDAREALSYEALLGDDLADVIFADPPYNVPIDGHVSGNGRNHHREFVIGSGEMTAPEFTGFLRPIFRNCVRFSRDGSELLAL